ncbi:hypothetical protein [Paraburkholderia pallida]|uniref:Uncharacterized protein n=1 Tax=Paraburkholderia pallida TaxID=2547399 RepID=A0A4V1AZ32_9BURK|nr:hypothetical protein [Paraburkholderia pallida]QBQ97862.1 hypothetical protein E1956_12200 [Paraburkholderia pallida]
MDTEIETLANEAARWLAAARRSFDRETFQEVMRAEANGARLVCVADGTGCVSVALMDGVHVIAALFEIDADGHRVVRSLRAMQ